ncbi:hypothetical protein D3C77_605660 [compost metagenome]
MPEVATEIQRNVKRSIETMTGLTVVEVNVHIHDVIFKTAEKSDDTELNHRVK